MTIDWQTPIPLSASTVSSFPVTALPLGCRMYAQELAEAVQVPVDVPSMLMLAVGGACMANKYEIQGTPAWSEPCNLYVCTILPPANRKSAIFKAVTAPLLRAEQKLCRQMAPHIEDLKQEHRIKEAALQKAELTASRASDDERAQAIEEAKARRRDIPEVPALPRLLVDDVTQEQLAVMLSQNNGRIALMSPEGGVFNIMGGLYSKGTENLDVYLKGHVGDFIRVDRIGRPSVSIDKPALTIGLAVQPGVIKGLTNKVSLRERGLIGRFLFSMPPSPVGYRKIDPKPVNPATKAQYDDTVETLLKNEVDCGEDRIPKPRRLFLDDAAKICLKDFEQEIENKLAPGAELEYARDWGGKLCGAVLRVAAILHGFKHPQKPEGHQIDEKTMISAILVGGYLEDHALAVLDLLGADPALDDARHVLEWIKRTNIDQFTQRDAYQALKGRFKRVHELVPALAVLGERNYLKQIKPSDHSGPGRKPGPVYFVNPASLSQNSQNPQNRPNMDNFGDIGDFERPCIQ